MKLYGEISKTEKQDDGTIKVWGWASTESVDSDGEIVTADAMKAAIPDYMKFGAVREMHQSKAAGTAIEAEVNEEGNTWFGAHVVDSEAVKKVLAGVYKGFSIGGKVIERDNVNKSIIKGLKLVEVSLVDRPANPDAVITIFKADDINKDDGATDTASLPVDENALKKDDTKGDGESAVDTLAEMINKGEISAEKLVELAKAANEPAVVDENVNKGVWTLSEFSSVLQQIAYICQDAQWDADFEGDNSPIPAQLRAWIGTGVQIFKDMAVEELGEMLSALSAQAGEIEVITLGEKTYSLAKAGATYSKATKDALSDIHKSIKECCDKLDGMNYQSAKEEDDTDKSSHSEDLQKAAKLEEDLSKLSSENETLKKRVAELEAKPAEGKATLKAVEKSDDVIRSEDKVEPIKKSDGSVDSTATLIKGIHQQGARLIGV